MTSVKPENNPKRKIKAKHFVRDLRNGMGDGELMAKYTLSEGQFRKMFQKLVDAGLLDEIELFMRTSLSDSGFSKAFVVTKCSIQDNLEEITPPRDIETPSEVATEENLSTRTGVFGRIFSKIAGVRS